MEILDFKNIVLQMDLTDTHISFHPIATKCTFFSSTYEVFFNIDHILDHKTGHNEVKKVEIVSNIFFFYNESLKKSIAGG